MKNKDDKKKDVESLRKELEASKNLFVTGYEKLRVESGFRAAQGCSRFGRQIPGSEEQSRGQSF